MNTPNVKKGILDYFKTILSTGSNISTGEFYPTHRGKNILKWINSSRIEKKTQSYLFMAIKQA